MWLLLGLVFGGLLGSLSVLWLAHWFLRRLWPEKK